MRVFFTEKTEEIKEKEDIEALDIVTSKYRIAIRTSGIKIDIIENKVNMLDENLDLT